jgi:urease accessory protein
MELMDRTSNPPLSLSPAALLRLLQLCSTNFPTGAFAYSQALEAAVEAGFVTDVSGAKEWILSQLTEFHPFLDLPALTQAYRCVQRGALSDASQIAVKQLALRDTRESREEDERVGRAALRTLAAQGLAPALAFRGPITWAVAFALAAATWQVDWKTACHGYLFTWLELQSLAATRLVPLGQRDAQAILSAGIELIPAVVAGHTETSPLVGRSLPGITCASMQHEVQYSRLFLS